MELTGDEDCLSHCVFVSQSFRLLGMILTELFDKYHTY